MTIQNLMFFVQLICEASIPGIGMVLGEKHIANLYCSSKRLKNCEFMKALRIKAVTNAHFHAMIPQINFQLSGLTQMISPSQFYCIRLKMDKDGNDPVLTCVQYKVKISNDGQTLTLISHIYKRPCTMIIKHSEKTNRLKFVGRVVCTYRDGTIVETDFDIIRRSPMLFLEILDKIKSKKLAA